MGVRPRPTEDEYLQLIKDGKLIIKDPDGQEVDLTADGLMIDIVDAKEYETNSNLVASTDDADKMHQIIVSEDYDTYMIVISGLEKPGEYTVVSDEVTGYTYEVVEGDKSIIYNKENAEFEKIWEGEEGDEVTITVSWMPDYDKIIESLHKAITVKGTYTHVIEYHIKNVEKIDKNDRQYVIDTLKAKYLEEKGKDLEDILKKALVGDFEDYVLSVIQNQIGNSGDLTLHAKEDGSVYVEITITKADGWKKTVEGLAIPADATIEEKDIDGYKSSYEREGNKITFTNSELVDVEVTKVWDDQNDVDGVRPASVTIKLLADGEATGDTLTLNEENMWTGTFDNLAKYNDGEEIAYTVEEDAVAGYAVAITGDVSNGYTVTNTHDVEKTSVSVTKVWDDLDNQDSKRPGSITINLLADGEVVDSKKVTALDDWKCQFTDLDVNKNGTKIAYTITEDFIPFYMTEISGSADQGYTVKNTHRPWFPNIPGTPGDTTELTVKKTVSGAAEEDKAFDIYVRFTSGDDTYVELLNLKATDEAYSFDLVEYGTKIEIIENAPGYDMTCRVNGEEMTSFEVSKDGGDKIEVIVNNHKDVPKEPEKPQDKPEPTPEKKTAVKTGDETNILGYSLLMAIGVLGALVVTRKKHQ